MDSELRAKLGSAGRNIRAILAHTGAKDPETREYALSKLVDYYMGERKFGALKEMCLAISFPEKSRERAGMAIINSIRHQNGERAAPAEGILEDLALSTKAPGKVRTAAGKLRVDLLSAKVKEGKAEAAAAKKKLAEIAGHGKHQQDVREYARNSLDALELAKEKKTSTLPIKAARAAGLGGKAARRRLN